MCRVAAKPDKARTLTTMCTTIGSRRAAAPRSSAAGLLVKTELIPRRIGEYRKCAHACADIRTRRQNAPPCSLDPLERIGDSIHHDIGPCPFVSSPIALLDPCAAHSAGVSKASSPSPRLLTFQPKMLL